jgi:hypothetical protein
MATPSKEIIDLLGAESDETTGLYVWELSLASPSVYCRGFDLENLGDLRNCEQPSHRAPPEPAKD